MKDHYESKTGETVVTARLPVHIEVQDYHEFPEVQDKICPVPTMAWHMLDD